MKTNISSLLRKIKLVVFDFDGVFTNNKVYVDQFGKESVCCDRSDGIGLRMLDSIGVNYWIISTEKNPVVSKRAQKLKIHCIQGTDDKVKSLRSITDRVGISIDKVAFVGNDINDLEVLKIVGLPVVVRDAQKNVKQLAKIILHSNGGDGAVREFCEMIVTLQRN